MDSLTSKCIEQANSTDCLLRAIINFLEDTQKKNDAKFEWDPITFGFTVSIALIAAGFALITIVQAVLVAGPGRRKSNSEAIGKWSKHTTRKWRFWDLGYLHIAKTPILGMGNVLAHLESANPKIEKTDHRSEGLAANAAKWLVFLDEVGLSHLELPDDALETWLADYLPGDLLAVPALIEVRLIYVFMSLFCKPFRALGTDKKYPALMGKDFQFEVRQHPTLGSIATFSKYRQDSKKARTGRMTPKRLFLIAEQAQGIVFVSAAPVSIKEDTDEEKNMQEAELRCLKSAGVVDRVDFSYQTRLPGSALHGHWSFCTSEERFRNHGQRPGFAFTLSLSSTTLFALIFADISKAMPEIFPHGKLDFKGIFEPLCISANIANERGLEPEKESTDNADHLLSLVFSPMIQKYGECPVEPPLRGPLGSSTCRCQLIVKACKRILQNRDIVGGGFLGIAAEDLFRLREDVIGMILVVESWLRRQSLQRAVRCVKFSLVSEVIQLQHIAEFLGSNKPLSLGLSLVGFLHRYRDYIESGTDDEFMWRIRDESEDDPGQFRKLLRALAKSSGVDETLIEDLKEDPSLGGLIPTNAVWPREPCKDEEISLDLKLFKFGNSNKDIDIETMLNHPRYDDIAQPDIDLIRRVLGWRVLFVTILYMTAFDNTDMLDSGSWNQILPML